jgi:hypothetical protein
MGGIFAHKSVRNPILAACCRSFKEAGARQANSATVCEGLERVGFVIDRRRQKNV